MQQPKMVTDGGDGAESLKVLQGWIGALMSGKAAEVEDDFWAEDAVVSVPLCLPYGGEYPRERMGEYRAALMDNWEIMPTPPDLYAAGDKVFLIGAWKGKSRKTGKSVDMSLLEIFTVRDGKIVHDEFFFGDTGALVAALTD